MVHISRFVLGAIAVFLTHITIGAATNVPAVSLHRMATNDEVGTGLTSPIDSANPVVKSSCAISNDKGTKGDTCQPDPNDATPVETVETTKRAKRDEDTSRAYLLSTIHGINRAQYEEWAKKTLLRDKKGEIIARDELEWVSCGYLNLTDAEAATIRQDPIIRFIEPNTEDDGELRVIPPHADPSSLLPSSLHVKAQALNQRDDSAAHLKLLSARNQRNDPTKLPNYVFEPSLGKGQTIYVLDSGYRKTHQEFDASEREVRDHTVPNPLMFFGLQLTNEQQGPEDMYDVTGHGTMVASIAAGYVSGVASKANLVVVKMRNRAKNPLKPDSDELLPRGVMDIALEEAFQWTLVDIKYEKLKNPDPNARYIVNLSYGWIKASSPGKIAVLENALAEFKKEAVTLVIAAGNDGEHRTLDSLIPQTYGTDNRFEMITVGGVDQTGKYYAQTVQGKEGQGGQVDVYADAVQVVAAKHDKDSKDDSTAPVDGTSAAAPAIAGLAAYLFSIPGLSSNWGDDTAPADMKKFMLKNSEVRNDNPFKEGEKYPTSPKPDKESLKVPYNLAQNTLCDLPDAAAKRSLFTKRAPTPEKSVPGRPIIEGGEVVNEDLKNEICNVHNRPAPETEPEQTPEAPAPTPNTAGCEIRGKGIGAGEFKITGSGWGDEASLKKKFGDWAFKYTGGDSFTATFMTAMEPGEVEKAVREMSGLGDVTCT